MAQTEIQATRRTPEGKNANRRMRKAGRIPAVIYGPGKEPLPVSVDPEALGDILYSDSGRNTIFTVTLEGHPPVNAMVKQYQLDPVKGNLIHSDLLEIAMDRLLRAERQRRDRGRSRRGETRRRPDGHRDPLHRRRVPALGHPGFDQGRCDGAEDQRLHPGQEPPRRPEGEDPHRTRSRDRHDRAPIKEEEPVVEAPAETAEPEVIKKGKVVEEGEAATPEEKK